MPSQLVSSFVSALHRQVQLVFEAVDLAAQLVDGHVQLPDIAVFLFKLLLQVANVLFELFLSFLMLALEGEDLVVCLAGLSTITEAAFIRSRRLLLQLLDGSFHAHNAVLGKEDLVAH